MDKSNDEFIINFIKQSIETEKKIAIYPYGSLGKKVEKILIDKFNIIPSYIFDNQIYETNSNILPISSLDNLDYKEIDKILICTLSYANELISSISPKWLNKISSFFSFCVADREFKRFEGKEYRSSGPFNLQISTLTNIQLLNKQKENDLKNKIKNKCKIRVMFLVDEIAKFKAKTVYEHMKHSEIFEPFIVVFKLYNVEDSTESDFYSKNHEKNLHFFRENNYVVYDAYDETGNVRDLEDFDPDIIFTSTITYIDSPKSLYGSYYLYSKWLVCYLNYGINTSAHYDNHFNNPIISCCWKHFEVLKSHYTEMILYSKYCGINTKYLGNPFLDDYVNISNNNELLSKEKQTVIYAPHWTIDICNCDFNSSTFNLFSEEILELAKNNLHINFVFKPHPHIKYLAYINTKKPFPLEKYTNFLNRWNSLDNCRIYDGPEYINLFKTSSLLITDCYSFIGEWLPSGNPCIFLSKNFNKNEFKHKYDPVALDILSTYYIVSSNKQIQDVFYLIMHEKNDPQKELRKIMCQKYFNDIGGAGERIVKYIEKCLN